MMMDHDPITCDDVDTHDLDVRYLDGRLTDVEATAFEAHYFGCDRCWTLVRHGEALRATAAGAEHRAVAGAPVSAEARAIPFGEQRRAQHVERSRRRSRWWSRRRSPAWLAVAATLVIAVAGVELLREEGDDLVSLPSATLRGAADSLAIVAIASVDGLGASWRPVESASAYRARVFTRRGELLFDREVTDTFALVPWSDLPARSDDSLFWQIQPLDLLRAPLGRSSLVVTPSQPPSPSPPR